VKRLYDELLLPQEGVVLLFLCVGIILCIIATPGGTESLGVVFFFCLFLLCNCGVNNKENKWRGKGGEDRSYPKTRWSAPHDEVVPCSTLDVLGEMSMFGKVEDALPSLVLEDKLFLLPRRWGLMIRTSYTPEVKVASFELFTETYIECHVCIIDVKVQLM